MICKTFCKNCGQSLPEGAKFCINCGTRVPEEAGHAFCANCGAPLEPGARFCASCGVKTGGDTAGTVTPPPPPPPIPTTDRGAGTQLTSWKMTSLYEGEPKVGIAKATGMLTIYDDRLEFKKQMGSALGGAFGAIGMAVAHSKIKSDPVDIYPLSQVAQLRTGKYGGVYNTLVVVLRDGRTVSFCPAAPASSAPENAVRQLTPYIQAR